MECGVQKTHMHCMKIVCICQRLVFGAHFPENKFWERCPAENCATLVTQFVSVLEKNERDCWFQQYGATANTAKATEAFLQNIFGYRAVGRRFWP